MVTLTRITSPDTAGYLFTEQLLTASFPQDEYRDLAEQRCDVSTKKNFHLMVASENEQFVGFISFWELSGFYYVEHLATLPSVRGKGCGAAILKHLQSIAKKIVLEVEEPCDEISRRRIAFYSRSGFTLCSTPYTQPPYRIGGNPLPMLLMFCGWEANNDNFEKAKKDIYTNIYKRARLQSLL